MLFCLSIDFYYPCNQFILIKLCFLFSELLGETIIDSVVVLSHAASLTKHILISFSFFSFLFPLLPPLSGPHLSSLAMRSPGTNPWDHWWLELHSMGWWLYEVSKEKKTRLNPCATIWSRAYIYGATPKPEETSRSYSYRNRLWRLSCSPFWQQAMMTYRSNPSSFPVLSFPLLLFLVPLPYSETRSYCIAKVNLRSSM